MNAIYLDNNATTPMLPEVVDAMHQCYAASCANPASQHAAGRRARAVLEEAREGIAALLGADVCGPAADRLIFTSGGTEANNLALRGLVGEPPGHLIVSAIEHPSVAQMADELQRHGWRVDRLGVDGHGRVRADQLPELLNADTTLVSVMLGNNETGVLQPVDELVSVCTAAGVLLHTDATQVVGKLAVNFHALGVDALTCSAHKFHGPPGIGALVVRSGIGIVPLHFGGFQQGGLRPGTEVVALAVGMHTALQLWQRDQHERAGKLAALRDRFESLLTDAELPIVVNGAGAPRLPHTTNISFPGLDRQALLMALDLAGVACSTGSACASGSSEPSSVLLAMGLPEPVVRGTLRFSVGALNTACEVDEAARRIISVCRRLRRGKTPEKMATLPPGNDWESV